MKYINRNLNIKKDDILNDIKKRRLKVVLCRNDEYFSTKGSNTRSILIQKLMRSERVFLNIDECSGDSEVNKIIKLLVEERKADIFINSENESESIGKPSTEIQQVFIKEQRQQDAKENIEFPAIPKYKMSKFISLVNSKERANDYDRCLSGCLSRLNPYCKPHWSSPSYILKAIHHSILHREWSNVTRLVLIFMNNFPLRKYAPIIRYVCEIIAKMHPIVQAHSLQDQFAVINGIYRSKYT